MFGSVLEEKQSLSYKGLKVTAEGIVTSVIYIKEAYTGHCWRTYKRIPNSMGRAPQKKQPLYRISEAQTEEEQNAASGEKKELQMEHVTDPNSLLDMQTWLCLDHVLVEL